MNHEIQFLEKLRELKLMASDKNNEITDETIRDYFQEQVLTLQQLQMIRDYIEEDNKNEDELSEEDQIYLQEWGETYAMIPPLDTSDLGIYQRVIDGNRQAYETLAQAYMPTVLEVAKAHKTEGILLEDLVSEGLIGLTEGLGMISQADTAHHVLLQAIRKSICLYLMEREAEQSHDNTIIDKVRKMDEALDALKEDLGRKVYIEEVAEYMHISEEEVWDILKLTGEDVTKEDGEE